MIHANRRACAALALALGALLAISAPLAQASDYVSDDLYGWEDDKWSSGGDDCQIPPADPNSLLPTSTEWHVSGSHTGLAPNAVNVHFPCSKINALKISKMKMAGLDRVPIAGASCVCSAHQQNCVKIWGDMAYLGKAYDLTFTTVGYNRYGCGTSGAVNDRISGYIRWKSDKRNCIQIKGDVKEGMETHYWGDCGTGDNQQRRVMKYLVSDQELRVAADDSYCLALRDLGTADGNPVVARKCSAVGATFKKWLYEDNQLKLRADPSKCIRKVNSRDIQLGSCTSDNDGKWAIQWTQNH